MKKRLLAIIATAAMVVTMIPSMVFAADPVATVNGTPYTNLQEAIKAAAPNGTVEIVDDVTVDKWIMFAEKLSIGNGNIITLNINGLTINGNGHKLTINKVESAGNGNKLFHDAQNLNINDLIINNPSDCWGVGLQSGTLNNVTFNGGVYGVHPGSGEVTISDCSFKTNGTAIYYEEERDNLVVDNCTFDQGDKNVILLRGNTVFKNNTINSGRTVNVVSGSPVVEGNDFNDVRLKVYNDATAIISKNTVSNLEFADTSEPKSEFVGNTLSDDAKAALKAVGSENKPAPDPTPQEKPVPDTSPATGDNSMAPIAVAGLTLAAMAAVVATRRRTN